MKLTGFGAIACAALMAVACGGDARDDRGNDVDRTAGTSGAADDAAVNDDRDLDDTTVGTSGQHGATGDTRRFVETAALGGHAEVELGKLAAERAQSPDVKQFAQMMISDHSKANDELKQAASRENIDMPALKLDQKHQELMTKLRNLSGAEFDREYMSAMVDGHEEMKSLLEDHADRGIGPTARSDRPGTTGTSGSTAGTNAAVNQWAAKTLPSVEKHLQRAEEIQAKLDDRK